MGHLSSRRSLGAGVVLGAVGFIGYTVLMSAPAGADPQVPDDVWVQCTGFSGPNTTWPHPLTGCTARSGEGSGRTERTAPGTETIIWDKPFLGGKSMELTNIQNQPLGPDPGCPSTHPVAVDVSGTIGPNGQFAGSPVTATICANQTDFVLKPGTLFVIHRVPGSPGDVNPPS
jgi:hypothetical protein